MIGPRIQLLLYVGVGVVLLGGDVRAQQSDTLPVEDIRVCDKHERLICPIFSERCFCRPIGGWETLADPDTGYGEHDTGGGSTIVPPSDEPQPK